MRKTNFDYDEGCMACRVDATHSEKEHNKLIANEKKENANREDTLYRVAQKWYDRP